MWKLKDILLVTTMALIPGMMILKIRENSGKQIIKNFESPQKYRKPLNLPYKGEIISESPLESDEMKNLLEEELSVLPLMLPIKVYIYENSLYNKYIVGHWPRASIFNFNGQVHGIVLWFDGCKWLLNNEEKKKGVFHESAHIYLNFLIDIIWDNRIYNTCSIYWTTIKTQWDIWFNIFDESTYDKLLPSAAGHPEDSPHELFASILTILRYHPNDFLQLYKQAPSSMQATTKKFLEELLETILLTEMNNQNGLFQKETEIIFFERLFPNLPIHVEESCVSICGI